MNIKKLSIASLLLSTALFAGTYNVDKSHSNIGFKVKHMMISNVTGSFDNFNGSFEYDEKTNNLKSLSGKIITSSINTKDAERDEHLKDKDLFSAKKYPKIDVKLTKIEKSHAYVDMTLKGITKNIKLELENRGSLKDPWGNNRAAFALVGKINRQDFGISWNKALETGGVIVGDTVNLNIEIQGIKAK